MGITKKSPPFLVNFELTGSCTVDVELLIKYWNSHCALYLWDAPEGPQYILRESIWRRGKRTHTDKFKYTVKSEVAAVLISRLKLNREQGFFRSSATYRTAISEQQYVYDTMAAYIREANKEILRLKNIIKYGKPNY